MNPITQLRESLKLKRTGLSDLTGVSYHTLTSIEHGKPHEITAKTATKIAAPCNIPPFDLMRQYAEWRTAM